MELLDASDNKPLHLADAMPTDAEQENIDDQVQIDWNPGFSDVLDLPIILATFQKVDSRWTPGGF